MKLAFTIFSLFVIASDLGAQHNPLPPVQSDSNVIIEYFDSNYVAISKDSAWGFYEIKLDGIKATKKGYTMDSVLLSFVEFSNYAKKVWGGKVNFYYTNGNIKSEAVYLEDQLEGSRRKYYETGQIKSNTSYSNGELDGEVTCYHPNGAVSRKETFVDGSSKGGKCFGWDGRDTAYSAFNREAKFPKGDEAFMKWLQTEFIYPKAMQKAKESGRVMVRFAIDKDGSITNIKAIESTNPLLEIEAIRVLSAAPKWIPAINEGEYVKAWRQIPITLNLK